VGLGWVWCGKVWAPMGHPSTFGDSPVFEPTERITAMVDRLYALCEPLDRGDVLTHAAFVDVVECERHTEHYQWCLKLLKRRMRQERGIGLANERDVGYRLMTKGEQIDAPKRQFKRAIRRVRDGMKDVACLQGDENLSLHQRIMLNHRIDQCQRLEKDIRRQMQDQEWMHRPTQVNPIRPR
jgi:hypothetical protein